MIWMALVVVLGAIALVAALLVGVAGWGWTCAWLASVVGWLTVAGIRYSSRRDW